MTSSDDASQGDLGADLAVSLSEGLDTLTDRRELARICQVPSIDVRAIRARVGLSQVAFARRFGFSVAAVREWEQGRRQPEVAARVLLLVIARNPEVVDEAIRALEPVAA